jgi:hypothetical protein
MKYGKVSINSCVRRKYNGANCLMFAWNEVGQNVRACSWNGTPVPVVQLTPPPPLPDLKLELCRVLGRVISQFVAGSQGGLQEVGA